MMRIGTGFDAHRFAPRETACQLWLAGFRWIDDEDEGVQGLLGDSDGDVAVHALIDSLLSAADMGDIGDFFGIGQHSRANGEHGSQMLKEVVDSLHRGGWDVVNSSIVIVGNKPKVSRHRHEAQENLSEILQAPVSLTATTTDGLGFTGGGLGIAASATSLIVRCPRVL